tara:strand:- start:902 stop:1357 length:456 start_codon:yes stop_codon:yes gene_type:complete
METVILTFDKPTEVKGNIFATLNNSIEEDKLAKERANKINNAIFKKVNSIMEEIVNNIVKKIDIEGIEVTVYSRDGYFWIYVYEFNSRIATTILNPMHKSATKDKYPIYSEEFSIQVHNEYVSKVKGSLSTKEVSVIEEMILGDLKIALKI